MSKSQIFLLLVLLQASIPFCKGSCEYQYIEEDGECKHKNLFQQFSIYDILAIVLILILSLFGSVAGAGGGIFVVPIYLMILNFDTQDAVSSSVCMMGFTQILKIAISIKMRHPFRNKPIINYSIAALLTPPVFLGNIFGVILNMLLANLIIKIMFILLVLCTLRAQTKKGIQLWKKEQAAIKQQNKIINTDVQQLNEIEEKHIVYKSNQVNAEMQTNLSYLYQKFKKQNSNLIDENNIDLELEDDAQFEDTNLEPEEIPQEIKQQYDIYCYRDSRTIYWNRLIPIVLAFFIVSFTTLLKGSKRFDSIIGVETCSPWFWFLTLISTPFMQNKYFFFYNLCVSMIIIYFVVQQYLQENYIKQQVYQASNVEDIEWTRYNVIKFQIIGVIVGFLMSFLGIGGAIIWTPILLSYKIPPDVVSLTVQFLVLLGSINNLIQYLIMKPIIWDYVAFTSFIEGICIFIGLKLVLPYFVKKKKRSFIIFCLSIVEIGSLVLVIINAIIQAKSDSDKGKNIWAMKSFCD